MSTSRRFAVAVHILTLMAWAEDEPLKSEVIADSVNTNPVVIRRILCALARAGLVTSQTGAAGGSRLSRKPMSISLLDIHRAVEEGDAFLLHRHANPHCPVGMSIETVLASVLNDVNFAMERALSRVNVADVVSRIQSCKRARSGASKQSLRRSGSIERVSKGE
jgi:Rrf2 family protein